MVAIRMWLLAATAVSVAAYGEYKEGEKVRIIYVCSTINSHVATVVQQQIGIMRQSYRIG